MTTAATVLRDGTVPVTFLEPYRAKGWSFAPGQAHRLGAKLAADLVAEGVAEYLPAEALNPGALLHRD